MKLIPHIKKGFNIFVKDIKMMIVSFLVLPMALALVYGNMQKNLFDGKDQPIDLIKADFQYDESSAKGAMIKDILSQEKVKELIQDDEKEAQYTIVISKDFKSVDIECKDQGTTEFMILKNFTEAIVDNLNEYENLNEFISGLKISEEEKKNLIANIISKLNTSNEEPLFKEKIVEGYKTLNSMQYYTISMFSFTSLILIMTLAANFYKEVKEGIVKRSFTTPNGRVDYFIGFISNSFIISLLLSSLYIIINAIRGITFLGNPFYIALIVLLQGILSAAVVGMIIAFIKKDATATMVMNLLIIVPSMFGGVFFYSDFLENSIMKKIAIMVPNSMILNSYKDLAISGSLKSIQGELSTMFIISVIFLTISILKVQHKWEV
jgi:ABC-2 type transport system permease protein